MFMFICTYVRMQIYVNKYVGVIMYLNMDAHK
jgi:hypothetical protein